MAILRDIEAAADAIRIGFAGDILPVAANFNVVRFPRPDGGTEYRVYSYRTLVAIVTRARGVPGVRVDMCVDALNHSATTARHVACFLSRVVDGYVDWERLKAACVSAIGSVVTVPTVCAA